MRSLICHIVLAGTCSGWVALAECSGADEIAAVPAQSAEASVLQDSDAGDIRAPRPPTAFTTTRPQRDEATAALWGMRTGDAFVLRVAISKRTSVSLDGAEPQIVETRDRFELSYRVTDVPATGDVTLVVTARRAEREATAGLSGRSAPTVEASRYLADVRVGLRLDSEGNLLETSERDWEKTLSIFSGMDHSTGRLMRDTCPSDVASSWFARPFWVVGRAEDVSGGIRTIERPDVIPVGPYGILRLDVEISADDEQTPSGVRRISGKGRYVPLVISDVISESSFPQLSEMNIEMTEFAGKARTTSALSEQRRSVPPFHSMELSYRIQGTGTLKLPGNLTSQKMEFSQQQQQAWILTEYTAALPDTLFGVPVPDIPR